MASSDFKTYISQISPLINNFNDFLGLCYDTAHLHASGFKIDELYAYNIPYPILIHFNGNTLTFGAKKDIHTYISATDDRIFTNKDICYKFMKYYINIPMILERSE